jgi:hypothetical protein
MALAVNFPDNWNWLHELAGGSSLPSWQRIDVARRSDAPGGKYCVALAIVEKLTAQ